VEGPGKWSAPGPVLALGGPVWGEETPRAMLTKCGLWGDMVDVITYAIFGDCRLRGGERGKFAFSHWLGVSPLQHWSHYRVTVLFCANKWWRGWYIVSGDENVSVAAVTATDNISTKAVSSLITHSSVCIPTSSTHCIMSLLCRNGNIICRLSINCPYETD